MATNRRGALRQLRTTARLLCVVVALLAGLFSYTSSANANPLPQASSCAGVWVVVDYGSLGGTKTACAGSYGTGTAALRSAGFSVTLDGGMVVKINAQPATVNIQENYWSYWHATQQADGSYSDWSYSNLGASAYHPGAGSAEGWRYQAISAGYVSPGVAAPKQTAKAEEPVETQAPPAAAPEPTKQAQPATTAAAETTAAKKTTATTVAKATTQVTQTSEPPSPPQTPTASTSSAMVETSPSSSVPTASDLDVRTEPATQPASTSNGSLVGGVIAIIVITAGALGTLLWRKRLASKL